MTTQLLESVFTTCETVTGLWVGNFEKIQNAKGLNGERFDIDQTVPGNNTSLSGVDSRLNGSIDLITGLQGIDDVSLVPKGYFTNLKSALEELQKRNEELQSAFHAIDQNGGYGNLDPSNFSVQSKNGQQTIGFPKVLRRIDDALDNCLHHYYVLSSIVKGNQYTDFSSAFRELSKQLEATRKDRQKLATLLEEAEHALKSFLEKGRSELQAHVEKASAEHGELLALHEQAGKLQSELNRLKNDSEAERKTISEYAGESTEKVSSIRETAGQAEQLKTAVEGYKAQFEEFQKQLDGRMRSFTEGKQEQDRLIERLKEIEGEIQRLQDQAEHMLTGATVAGLASSFGEIRDNLTAEVNRARVIFYFAIVVLFVSVIPLVMLVIPGLSIFGLEDKPAAPGEFLGQMLVRALLLIPAAWFAKFAAARHAALFRLKEHYAYKYSVASSVEGFKKQAEPFKDAIAAATFFELTFNPAERMETKSHHEQRHPNLAMEWVMKKLGATYDGKSS